MLIRASQSFFNTPNVIANACLHHELCACGDNGALPRRLSHRLLTEMIGVPVKEHCTHRQSPSCCFESELKQSALRERRLLLPERVARPDAEKSYRTHGHIALAGDAIRAEIWAYFGTHLARRFAS